MAVIEHACDLNGGLRKIGQTCVELVSFLDELAILCLANAADYRLSADSMGGHLSESFRGLRNMKYKAVTAAGACSGMPGRRLENREGNELGRHGWSDPEVLSGHLVGNDKVAEARVNEDVQKMRGVVARSTYEPPKIVSFPALGIETRTANLGALG